MTRNDISQHDLFSKEDHRFMRIALNLAKKAEINGEVPIGAVVVDSQGHIIAKAANVRENLNTVIGHAEILALHRACLKQKSWRLSDCTLYVTLEPCFMCAGALSQARIKRVVYATPDPKGGALGSLDNLSTDLRLNHRFVVENGLLAAESCQLLKNFFKLKRKNTS